MQRFEAALRALADRLATGRPLTQDELARWMADTYAGLECGPGGRLQTVEEISAWIAETYPELGLDC